MNASDQKSPCTLQYNKQFSIASSLVQSYPAYTLRLDPKLIPTIPHSPGVLDRRTLLALSLLFGPLLQPCLFLLFLLSFDQTRDLSLGQLSLGRLGRLDLFRGGRRLDGCLLTFRSCSPFPFGRFLLGLLDSFHGYCPFTTSCFETVDELFDLIGYWCTNG